jgi:ribosomal protein S18 acetylase RimI-like enzyme
MTVMADVVARAMALWGQPVPDGEAGLTAFRDVYADPVVVNGVETELSVVVERARMLQGAIADLAHHVDALIVTQARRAFAFRITGRHAGPLLTPLGTVPATDRRVEIAGMEIFEVDEVDEADGRVTRIWAIADHARLLAALDAVTLTGAESDDADTAAPVHPGRLSPASDRDAAELLVLQRCCWVAEAVANDTLEIPALHESLDDVRTWLKEWSTWCLRAHGRLIGAVRARREGTAWEIGRLMVAPDLSGRGIGRWLLRHAEDEAPAGVGTITLFTGARNVRNLAMYERAGYTRTDEPAPPNAVRLAKRVAP